MSVKTIKTRKEFDDETEAAGNILALFYSAWCPFCTSFMPDFEKSADAAPASFIKVCTDDLPELEDLFAVEVVPTVLYFSKGKLAARLDGELGRGLTAEKLTEFAAACGGTGAKKPRKEGRNGK